MSDSGKHPRLPGPRKLFPDLFRDDRYAHGPGQMASASVTPLHSQTMASAPSTHAPGLSQAPKHSSSHTSQCGRTRGGGPSPSRALLPVGPRAPGFAQSPLARGTAATAQQQTTLRPADWNDQTPGSSSSTDKKRYGCELCERRFERPSSLETHMNSHTGERPFKCTTGDCQKAFTTKSNMQRHQRTHDPKSLA
ncbi:uncharacterized protein PHACADRAFT_205844 [Phanerochaete carnosa HHB-10118-sp]|uniref:C2H2-type domain-containing protein n=1 Tax=Phanerochaete carnosa (strain HHB-10118-sp) TaxID=650164 RepID=K5WKD6_PHACS|nr:uncharacterized protein PHACADRAFT_205844 [Phanerochaete carnosa HHB-10118-sp]EKM59619.1 hypothetical protein PHACADRAFT_205844 [Phanerochaete carnosa HHB-10118-sp]